MENNVFNSIKEINRLRKKIVRKICQTFIQKLKMRKTDVLKTSVF